MTFTQLLQTSKENTTEYEWHIKVVYLQKRNVIYKLERYLPTLLWEYHRDITG